MAAWPSELPPPSLNSLTESPPNNTIRSNMDKGPAKVRRRTTANIRPINFELKLTEDQLDVLDNFYDVVTFSGADSFDYVHPRTGDNVEARFTQPPQYAEREGTIYNASIALEIMP